MNAGIHRRRLKRALVLTLVLAGVLLAGAVWALLKNDGRTPGNPGGLSWGGGDLAGLALTLPLLTISAILTVRGGRKPLLVWGGALTYLVSTTAAEAFAPNWNISTPLRLLSFSLAFFSLISLLAAIDAPRIARRFRRSTPVRVVSIVILLGVGLSLVWLVHENLKVLLEGGTPDLDDRGSAPGLIRIFDLAVVLPLAAVTAFWLWRRRPWGYVLGGIFLVANGLSGMAMALADSLAATAGLPHVEGLTPISGGWTLLCLAVLAYFLSKMKSKKLP